MILFLEDECENLITYFRDTVAPFVIRYQGAELEGSQPEKHIRTTQHSQQEMEKVVTTDFLDFVNNSDVELVKVHLD